MLLKVTALASNVVNGQLELFMGVVEAGQYSLLKVNTFYFLFLFSPVRKLVFIYFLLLEILSMFLF